MKLSLSWNAFDPNISNPDNLRWISSDSGNNFADVFLITNNQQKIGAHRLVLKRGSLYFEEQLEKETKLISVDLVKYEDLVASMQGQAEQKRVYSKVVFMKTQIIVKQWIYCPSQTDMIFVKFFTHYKCSNIKKSQMFIYDRLHIKSDHGNSFLFCHLQYGWKFSLLFCLFLLGPNLYTFGVNLSNICVSV